MTSVAHDVVLLDPVGTVMGELACRRFSESKTRLHVFLSDAAKIALQIIRDKNLHPPKIQPCTEAPTSEVAPAGVATRTFTVTSFMRRELESACTSFLMGVKNQYDQRGITFLDPAGQMKIQGKLHRFTDLVTRVPGYFLRTCKDSVRLHLLYCKTLAPQQCRTLNPPPALALSLRGLAGTEVQRFRAQHACAAAAQRLTDILLHM